MLKELLCLLMQPLTTEVKATQQCSQGLHYPLQDLFTYLFFTDLLYFHSLTEEHSAPPTLQPYYQKKTSLHGK